MREFHAFPDIDFDADNVTVTIRYAGYWDASADSDGDTEADPGANTYALANGYALAERLPASPERDEHPWSESRSPAEIRAGVHPSKGTRGQNGEPESSRQYGTGQRRVVSERHLRRLLHRTLHAVRRGKP